MVHGAAASSGPRQGAVSEHADSIRGLLIGPYRVYDSCPELDPFSPSSGVTPPNLVRRDAELVCFTLLFRRRLSTRTRTSDGARYAPAATRRPGRRSPVRPGSIRQRRTGRRPMSVVTIIGSTDPSPQLTDFSRSLIGTEEAGRAVSRSSLVALRLACADAVYVKSTSLLLMYQERTPG
jgi:hypothetical protein